MDVQDDDQLLQGILLDDLFYLSPEPTLDSASVAVFWIIAKHKW